MIPDDPGRSRMTPDDPGRSRAIADRALWAPLIVSGVMHVIFSGAHSGRGDLPRLADHSLPNCAMRAISAHIILRGGRMAFAAIHRIPLTVRFVGGATHAIFAGSLWRSR